MSTTVDDTPTRTGPPTGVPPGQRGAIPISEGGEAPPEETFTQPPGFADWLATLPPDQQAAILALLSGATSSSGGGWGGGGGVAPVDPTVAAGQQFYFQLWGTKPPNGYVEKFFAGNDADLFDFIRFQLGRPGAAKQQYFRDQYAQYAAAASQLFARR